MLFIVLEPLGDASDDAACDIVALEDGLSGSKSTNDEVRYRLFFWANGDVMFNRASRMGAKAIRLLFCEVEAVNDTLMSFSTEVADLFMFICLSCPLTFYNFFSLVALIDFFTIRMSV